MNGTRKMWGELAPTISAAVIFLASMAVSMCATFKVPASAVFDLPVLTMPAAVASILSFFGAGILIFSKPRLGYCLGLAGGLIVAVSLAQTELELAPRTTWMALTAALNTGQPSAPLVLRVLAGGLAASALCCAAIRMLPAGWSVRGTALRQRTWPALAAGMAISTFWAIRDATPYYIPVCRMGVSAEFSVLHVRKSGLTIQQTTESVFRDQKFYYDLEEHRLFQSRVEMRTASGAMPYEQWAGLVHPPATWTQQTAPAKPVLWSWNAEQWYVRSKDGRLFVFTGPPPYEIAEFVNRVEKLVRAGRQWSGYGRDICLGFRYDPLGGMAPEEKAALLHTR